ncbi:hypothetical protein [Pseudarthrobacter sp. L1SW]|uniref:hypothetical protein n=1 Tax=Pseudarthrobacter sp. L1SW TaxID=2851598 RepID=UPI001E2DFE55|nr:hypothetical protein [Pseudarthrobacter sp. L1SW]UEL27920.1 hypothetical protein KTR40_15230 [Pseudarthrobacter sp. L1SW]
MSTPPVPPPVPNDPESGSESGSQGPRYGQNTPQYGQQSGAPQYGQNAPQYGQQSGAPQYGQNAPQYGQQSGAPQYGQNAPQYGQQSGAPQYGQNAPQYGQQPYGQSPYAQYPSEQPQPSGSAGVPQLVNISFWLLIASAAIFVVSALAGLATLDDPRFRDVFDSQVQGTGAGVTYEDMKGVIAGTLVVFAIIGLALYLLVAFFVRKGKNWARILGTVFAALSVLGLFSPPSFATIGTLLGIAAIVLLYLPGAAPYFRRQQPFANPYGGGMGNPYGR